MFDKLGDLLSDALDSGIIFKQEEKQAPKEQIKPVYPPEIIAAFKKCGISEDLNYPAAKQAYREKLKYYHPDGKNDNPVLQKVAKEKTENLIENWKIIEKYFETIQNSTK